MLKLQVTKEITDKKTERGLLNVIERHCLVKRKKVHGYLKRLHMSCDLQGYSKVAIIKELPRSNSRSQPSIIRWSVVPSSLFSHSRCDAVKKTLQAL